MMGPLWGGCCATLFHSYLYLCHGHRSRSAALNIIMSSALHSCGRMSHAGAQKRHQGATWGVGNMHRGCTADATEAGPGVVAAVVMVTFDRPTYLRKSIDSLLSAHSRDRSFRRGLPIQPRICSHLQFGPMAAAFMGVLNPTRGLPSRSCTANKRPVQRACHAAISDRKVLW